MNSLLGLSFLAAGLLEIILPFAVCFYVTRRLGTTWRTVFIGALMFIASLIRFPLNQYTSIAILRMGLGDFSWTLLAAFPSLTAGVFEEGARYIAYRYLVKEHSMDNAVTYGAGHGGIESILIVDVNITIIGVILLTNPALLPAEQLAAINVTQAYMPFIGLYERAIAIIIQIGLSVMVMESFRKRDPRYFVSAVSLHFLIDFMALIVLTKSVFFTELIFTGFAIGIGVWTYDRIQETAPKE
ncbi:MAG: YhfC family intramembrane metalloprotease [Candidatus Bathyarchaeota archaeon]|nr:YhfC family intramembrane metalloprotease [Candidatus Bathyarchaeota archaeon]